jgi:alkylation response protein AidB-like acyl-CoA dehydrogenase
MSDQDRGFLELNETQSMIRDTVREFAEKEVSKVASHADEEGKFPIELFRKMAELSLTGITVPTEYGGIGADTLSFLLALEELAKICPSTALTLAAHTSLGTMPIVKWGSEEQKRKWVPPLAKGEYAGSLCLTEPNIGSDVAGAQVTAVRKGDRYVINGTKFYVTNASFGGSMLVNCLTDKNASKSKRLSLIIVPNNAKGVHVIKEEDKLGMRASATCVVSFENVEVPLENRLRGEGDGFEMVMDTLYSGRIGISALALGIAEGARDRAVAHARTRKQFDKPIGDFQAVAFMIADMERDIEASRLLVYQAARLKEMGLPYSKEASIAKLFSAEMSVRVCRDAIQVLGGSGFMREYQVERLYRDAKLCEIGEGTNEIQRLIISRAVLGPAK